MTSIKSELIQPNEVRQSKEILINYILIPDQFIRINCQIYYFENLDLVLIDKRGKEKVVVFKVKDNLLIQNAYTNQLQRQIDKYKIAHKIYVSEETEEIYLIIFQQLYVLKKFQNELKYIYLQLNTKLVKQFQLCDKYFISNWGPFFKIQQRKKENLYLSYRSTQIIEKFESLRIFILICHKQKTFICIFKKQQLKIIRQFKIDDLSVSLDGEQFKEFDDRNISVSLNGEEILIFYKINESFKLISLDSMQQEANLCNLRTEKDHVLSQFFLINQLRLFIIIQKQNLKEQLQIEDQNLILKNDLVYTIKTNRDIRFIKYSQRQGLLVFYAEKKKYYHRR